MTFRIRLRELLLEMLTASDDNVEWSEQLVNVVTDIEGLAKLIDELFLEETDYIERMRAGFNMLTQVGNAEEICFPKAHNLFVVLQLANALNEEQLDKPVPENLGNLVLKEEVELEEIRDPLGQLKSSFMFEHPANLEDSIAFLDLSAEENVSLLKLDSSQALTAICGLLCGGSEENLMGRRWVASSIENSDTRINYLKYHLLLEGNTLTTPVLSPNFQALQGIAAILTASARYEQFKEPFEILSEVNGRKTILDSFLSSYHTLENYMIRAKIVNVANKAGVSMFGIRHFKRMGLAVANKELDHFKGLFKLCWLKSIGGIRFDTFVIAKINELKAHADFVEADFHLFLSSVEATEKSIPLDNIEAIKDILPTLIYQIRCSIVHNKETEYHISNRELKTDTFRLIITNLCIPVMQRLAFGLPSISNPNPIRYDHSELRLY